MDTVVACRQRGVSTRCASSTRLQRFLSQLPMPSCDGCGGADPAERRPCVQDLRRSLVARNAAEIEASKRSGFPMRWLLMTMRGPLQRVRRPFQSCVPEDRIVRSVVKNYECLYAPEGGGFLGGACKAR